MAWELHQRAPLLDVRLVGERSLASGSLTLLAVFGVQAGILVVLFPFLQAVLGWSEVVALDGFTEFKTAPTEGLPDAVAVMDPFHVVRLAGDALDRCRRRIQQNTHGHRGRKNDPLYRARRMLHTGADLLTDKQKDLLADLFAGDEHVQVEATWGIYQGAHRSQHKAAGRLSPNYDKPGHGSRRFVR